MTGDSSGEGVGETGGRSVDDVERVVQVVDCENCGYTVGEPDFPNPPTCDECGGEAENATLKTESQVERALDTETDHSGGGS